MGILKEAETEVRMKHWADIIRVLVRSNVAVNLLGILSGNSTSGISIFEKALHSINDGKHENNMLIQDLSTTVNFATKRVKNAYAVLEELKKSGSTYPQLVVKASDYPFLWEEGIPNALGSNILKKLMKKDEVLQ